MKNTCSKTKQPTDVVYSCMNVWKARMRVSCVHCACIQNRLLTSCIMCAFMKKPEWESLVFIVHVYKTAYWRRVFMYECMKSQDESLLCSLCMYTKQAAHVVYHVCIHEKARMRVSCVHCACIQNSLLTLCIHVWMYEKPGWLFMCACMQTACARRVFMCPCRNNTQCLHAWNSASAAGSRLSALSWLSLALQAGRGSLCHDSFMGAKESVYYILWQTPQSSWARSPDELVIGIMIIISMVRLSPVVVIDSCMHVCMHAW